MLKNLKYGCTLYSSLLDSTQSGNSCLPPPLPHSSDLATPRSPRFCAPLCPQSFAFIYTKNKCKKAPPGCLFFIDFIPIPDPIPC